MFSRNVGQVFFLAIALTAFCSGANAEKTVYKWVDKDGVVHFSDAPPAESNAVETETLIIPKSPPVVTPDPSAASPPAVSATADKKPPKQPEAEVPVLFAKTDISKMSLADLDLRCEEAREKMITPLREEAIATCKQDKRRDPAWCERFNADFGEGGRTESGGMRPRLFDDLPECVEALQERNRRSAR
jgi:hypothetical protein